MVCSNKEYFHEVHIPCFVFDREYAFYIHGLFAPCYVLAAFSFENKAFLLAIIPAIAYTVYWIKKWAKKDLKFDSNVICKLFYFFTAVLGFLGVVCAYELKTEKSDIYLVVYAYYLGILLVTVVSFISRCFNFKSDYRHGPYLDGHRVRVTHLENNKKKWLEFFSHSQVESLFSTGVLYLEGSNPYENPEKLGLAISKAKKEEGYSRLLYCRDFDEYSEYFVLRLEYLIKGEDTPCKKELGIAVEDLFIDEKNTPFRYHEKALSLNGSSYFYGQHPDVLDKLLWLTLDTLEF